MKRGRLFSSLFLAATLACGENQTVQPTPGPLDGDWSGTSSGPNGMLLTFSVRIDQVDDKLRGDGTLTTTSASIPVTIRGSYVDPNVLFKISGSGFQDIDFTGTLTDPDTIDGQFDGSGFNAFDIILHRE